MFRRCTLPFFLLILAGCSSWTRISPPLPAEFPAFRQYRVWGPDSSLVLRSLRISDDSLSGVPVLDEIQCVTCRIGLALSQVDSLSSGKTEGIGAGIFGGVAGALGFLLGLGLLMGASGGLD